MRVPPRPCPTSLMASAISTPPPKRKASAVRAPTRRTGQVVLKIDEVDDHAWRAAIRRTPAPTGKLRTGQTEGIVWALLHEAGNTSRSEESRVLELVVPRTVDALLTCQHYEALGYADAASGRLIGGSLFEDDCDTALTWFIILAARSLWRPRREPTARAWRAARNNALSAGVAA
jgi:hypothetical protein